MKFLCGLALALIFFEGFISQCEGAGGSEEASSSMNLRNILGNLSADVYEEFLCFTGFGATEQTAKDGELTLGAIKRMFEDCITDIVPGNYETEEIQEYEADGNSYLTIYGDNMILLIFKYFGNLIQRIRVDYEFIDGVDYDIRNQIKENVFRKYSKQFTQLDIFAKNSFSAFLDEILNGGERICFSNLTKLSYTGEDFGNSNDLNSIFPNLEYLTLYKSEHFIDPIFISQSIMHTDMTCIKNVTKLKELKLLINPESYKLFELENIFKQNRQLSSLAVLLNDKIDILLSINMMAVETLEIYMVGSEFLNHSSENLQFKMPKLKRLNLRGELISRDPQIIDFINSFKKLKTLEEIVVTIDFYISNIDELTEIHELITDDNSNIKKLKEALKNFGRKNLNIKMWVRDDTSICNTYKSKVIEFNKKLRQSHKSTWKINLCSDKNGRNTMMFLHSE